MISQLRTPYPSVLCLFHCFHQTELNKLDVVVSLKLNQLYCMDNAVEGQTTEGGEDGDMPRWDGLPTRSLTREA